MFIGNCKTVIAEHEGAAIFATERFNQGIDGRAVDVSHKGIHTFATGYAVRPTTHLNPVSELAAHDQIITSATNEIKFLDNTAKHNVISRNHIRPVRHNAGQKCVITCTAINRDYVINSSIFIQRQAAQYNNYVVTLGGSFLRMCNL